MTDHITLDEMTLACQALTALVLLEYPNQYSLAEIASPWGGCTDAQVAALTALERSDLLTR